MGGEQNKGKAPLTDQSFCKLLGKVPEPVGDPPATLPPSLAEFWGVSVGAVPTLKELGYEEPTAVRTTPPLTCVCVCVLLLRFEEQVWSISGVMSSGPSRTRERLFWLVDRKSLRRSAGGRRRGCRDWTPS